MKDNFINIITKKKKKIRTYILLCPYLSLYFQTIRIHYHSQGYWDTDLEVDFQDWLWLINWLNKNHFDYHGLIEKGLALDATGLNIY